MVNFTWNPRLTWLHICRKHCFLTFWSFVCNSSERFGRQLQLLVVKVPGCESCLLNAANVRPTLSSSFEAMRSPQTSADEGVTSPSRRPSQTLLSRVLDQLQGTHLHPDSCHFSSRTLYCINCYKHTEIHAFLHFRFWFYTASPPKQLNLHLYTSDSLLSTSINANLPNNVCF